MNCPICGNAMLPATVNGRPGPPSCMSGCQLPAQQTSRAQQVMQGKLAGLDPGRQSVKVTRSEKELQADIVKGLKDRGYIVLETGRPLRKQCCEGCGNVFYPTGGNGNDRGVADLLVTRSEWGNRWKLIEVKACEKAERKPEQTRLADLGVMEFCWTWEMVERALGVDR